MCALATVARQAAEGEALARQLRPSSDFNQELPELDGDAAPRLPPLVAEFAEDLPEAGESVRVQLAAFADALEAIGKAAGD